MNHEPDMIDAIEGLRAKMKMEHDPAWQAGVHALIQEMMLAAAQTAIQRSEIARSQFYGALVPLLPEPAQQAPMPLHADPAPYTNGHHYTEDPYVSDDLPMPSMFRERV